MVTTVFDKVTYKARKRVACRVCGKTVARQTTLWQTLSPYNRDKATGALKTRDQILAELVIEAEAWKLIPAAHDRCLD